MNNWSESSPIDTHPNVEDELTPNEIMEKEQLIKEFINKQDGLRALLERISSVQKESAKLKSGNETLQTYIDNLTRNNAQAAVSSAFFIKTMKRRSGTNSGCFLGYIYISKGERNEGQGSVQPWINDFVNKLEIDPTKGHRFGRSCDQTWSRDGADAWFTHGRWNVKFLSKSGRP